MPARRVRAVNAAARAPAEVARNLRPVDSADLGASADAAARVVVAAALAVVADLVGQVAVVVPARTCRFPKLGRLYVAAEKDVFYNAS